MLNIYIMLVLSANLTIGLANLLTMCQAAFYGIGAYIGTLFLTEFNLPFVAIIAIVSLVTGLFSFVVSYASVKLKGDYFVLATMGFQLIVYTILYNWKSVTRGSNGIDVPDIKILGIWEISGIYSIWPCRSFWQPPSYSCSSVCMIPLMDASSAPSRPMNCRFSPWGATRRRPSLGRSSFPRP